MQIRQALLSDQDKLQKLQSVCPVGEKIKVSAVNTPDFFGRSKVYPTSKVFVACEGDKVFGSAACAIKTVIINHVPTKIGYEFQYFVSPNHRRSGVAKQLHNAIEEHFISEDVLFSYALILEGNTPSIKLFDSLGFSFLSSIAIPYVLVYRVVEPITMETSIRTARSTDLDEIANLINLTWINYNFFEPVSSNSLMLFIEKTPGYSIENIKIIENQNRIVGCLGYWDINQVMKFKVVGLSPSLSFINLFLNLLHPIVSLPKSIKNGEKLNQWCLNFIGFINPIYFDILLQYINNIALYHEISQLFFIVDSNNQLLGNIHKLLRTVVRESIYIKYYKEPSMIDKNMIFINSIDL